MSGERLAVVTPNDGLLPQARFGDGHAVLDLHLGLVDIGAQLEGDVKVMLPSPAHWADM